MPSDFYEKPFPRAELDRWLTRVPDDDEPDEDEDERADDPALEQDWENENE